MKLLPIGVHFGPHIKLNDSTALDVINRVYDGKPGVALVMEGSTWIAEAMPKGSLVVQRLHWLFEKVNLSELTEAQCYDLGVSLAKQIIPGNYPCVTHFMGCCEPQLDTIMDGRRLGAFEAGFADTLLGAAYGFCGLNSSMGKPESTSTPSQRPVIEAYALSFDQWSESIHLRPLDYKAMLVVKDALIPALIWGYHMYQDPNISNIYLGLRPWVFWEKDLKAIGLVMPPILGTEAGIDCGGKGGYRLVFGANASLIYPEYIKAWPLVFSKAIGGCFFGVMMGDDKDGISWYDKGFDFEEDLKVIQAMRDTNLASSPNDFNDKMDKLWLDVQVGLWKIPAFKKTWLANFGKLGYISEPEFDVGDYRFQRCDTGYIWAKIGDWGNCHVATCREEMPPLG